MFRQTIIPLYLLLVVSSHVYGNGHVTFHLEDLSAPESVLDTKSFNEVYYDLLGNDYTSLDKQDIVQAAPIDDVLSHSLKEDRFVSFGYNSFFFGMCEAYASHRPVVLSPDVIWILISQGFAHHINANSQKYRNLIIEFNGTRDLAVKVESHWKDTDWSRIINAFYRLVSSDAKNGLAETMLCDFSTTDEVDVTVSQVNLMETVKSYYNFLVRRAICGIPSVTLQGTADDWRKVRDKTLAIEKYDLSWWTKRLIPILDEFIKAAEGHADIAFWKKMVHVTEPGQCGDPRIIDGWITDFYPYDKDGRKRKGGPVTNQNKLPGELVKVKLRIEDIFNGINGPSVLNKDVIEVWAGIWGLDQDDRTFALTPKVGWMVRKTDGSDVEMKLLSKANVPDSFGIIMEVDSIPSTLKHLGHIYRLDLTFRNRAKLPKWFGDMDIDHLVLRGQIPRGVRLKARKCSDDVRINPGARKGLF